MWSADPPREPQRGSDGNFVWYWRYLEHHGASMRCLPEFRPPESSFESNDDALIRYLRGFVAFKNAPVCCLRGLVAPKTAPMRYLQGFVARKSLGP